MKNMKRNFILAMLLVLILVLSIGLTGCDGTSAVESEKTPESAPEAVVITDKDIKGEVTIWHTYSDSETEVFENEVIPMFEKEFPNITVIPTRMPYDGLKQQVIAGVSGDAAPDLMRMDIIWVPEFAKLGALENITTYSGFSEIKDQVFEGPLQTNFYDGNYYGLPLNTNTKIAIYNKSLLAEVGLTEPPTTIDELIEVSRQLIDKGETWGMGVGGAHTWGMLPYFWSLGGEVTNENFTKASGYLNSPDSIEALDTVAALYAEGVIGPSILGEQPDTWGGMENANYLMIEDGPWYYSIIGEAALENTVSSIMPAGKGGSVSVVGGEDIVMFNTSKNKEAAWIFMKWMLTEEPQIKMASMGLVPTNAAAASSEEVFKTPYIENYIEQLKTAKPRTPNPNWEKMSEIIGLAFETVIRGEQDAKTTLDEAAILCDELLSE